MLITDQVATAPCTDPVQEGSFNEHHTKEDKHEIRR